MCRLLVHGFIAFYIFAAGAVAAAGYAPFDGAASASTIGIGAAGKETVVEGTITAFAASNAPGQPSMAIISPEGQKPPVVVAWMPELDATIYGNAGAPKVGTRLTAMGKVWDWQGMLLIRVRELNQIRIESHSHTYLRGVTAAAVAPAVAAKPVVEQAGFYGPENVPELPKLIGKEIAFCGTVTAFRKSWSDKAPNIATLGEVPNALEMVYWTNNGQTEPAGASTIGSTVCVTGLLQDYRGKMQLRVNDLGKMSVRQAPATVTAPASAAAAVAPLPSAPAPAPSSAEPMAAPFAAAP